MKNFWKSSLIILLVFGAVGTAIYLDFRANQNRGELLQTKLSQAISKNQTGEISVVDLATISTFSWDRVYTFGPYSTHERIERVLGNFWLDMHLISIESSDQVTLLVFTKNGVACNTWNFQEVRVISQSQIMEQDMQSKKLDSLWMMTGEWYGVVATSVGYFWERR